MAKMQPWKTKGKYNRIYQRHSLKFIHSTAKRKLERLGIQISSSFVKI